MQGVKHFLIQIIIAIVPEITPNVYAFFHELFTNLASNKHMNNMFILDITNLALIINWYNLFTQLIVNLQNIKYNIGISLGFNRFFVMNPPHTKKIDFRRNTIKKTKESISHSRTIAYPKGEDLDNSICGFHQEDTITGTPPHHLIIFKGLFRKVDILNDLCHCQFKRNKSLEGGVGGKPIDHIRGTFNLMGWPPLDRID